MEDPKASLDFSLTKLEENRRQLSRSLIEVSAAKRRLENQRNEVAAAMEKYATQARASVEAGRDDLARNASTYHRLLEMGQSGQLGWDDASALLSTGLARVRSEGTPPARPAPQTPQHERDPEIVRICNTQGDVEE